MKPLRILIADDHELLREGLRARLEKQDGWMVCGEAVNGCQAVQLARSLKPDVAVVDISMPELSGVEATRQICRESPATAVLILTMQDSEALMREVLAAGARGFVLKTDTPRLLLSAVEALGEGRPFFSGKIAELVLGGFLSPASPGADKVVEPNRLSPREREIAQLLAEGRTNKEVAAKLGVSVKTIDAHRTNIMRRLNIHSLAELVRYAIRERIVEA